MGRKAKSREFNDRILAGLLGIAGISLLVGGIGVANMMITSVTERTREVGIRKALGATRRGLLKALNFACIGAIGDEYGFQNIDH